MGSPVAFAKKYEYEGFIRRFCPELRVRRLQNAPCCDTVHVHGRSRGLHLILQSTFASCHGCVQDMPKSYLLEPWKAPEAVQKKANCIIGKDYPSPIVDHNSIHKENILR